MMNFVSVKKICKKFSLNAFLSTFKSKAGDKKGSIAPRALFPCLAKGNT